MKKLLGLTLCVMFIIISFASTVNAKTIYNFDSFTQTEGYGTVTKVDDNVTNLKGETSPNGGMYLGPFSKASTAKLDDGILEETYVQIDLEKLKQGNLFEVSLALKNADDQYVSEAVVTSQMDNGVVNVTAGWSKDLHAVIKESGVYTYQWKMYKDGKDTYLQFTLLKYDEVIGRSKITDFDSITTQDTKNPIADQKDVSVKYLWFCNIQVPDGVNVYAELPPKPGTPETPEPEQSQPQPEQQPQNTQSTPQKDVTPKTGIVNMINYASIIALLSLAGIVVLKRK